MRGKSSSSKSRNEGMECEKLEKSKEPQLSGAYIRSLVKQLTSSRTKDSPNLNEQENLEGEGTSSNQSLCRNSCEGFSDQNQEKSQPPPQQHKKQVRRRLHASRPYQERLLNMAEARREIVTALKFHRAAMKQASEKQQQQQQHMESGPPENHPLEPSSHHHCLDQDAKMKSRRNPRIYASNSPVPNNIPAHYADNTSYSPGYCCPYSWSASPMAPPPLALENLNLALPSQPLGLNLNLQDFSNLDTAAFHRSTNPASIFSYSSASTSSSPVSANTDENPCFGAPPPSVLVTEVAEYGDSGLHPAMDDKEIAEIRSIGEQYQMEWNDTMNLVNSAWWCKFLKETDNEPENLKGEYLVNSPFDEVMEFPAWLNTNESCLQHVTDCCSDDYYQDPALPCMDIEEIEGMDGDWLS